jgi:hypothetical protein
MALRTPDRVARSAIARPGSGVKIAAKWHNALLKNWILDLRARFALFAEACPGHKTAARNVTYA